MMVERLFLAVPQGCLRFVIVVFPDHTHLLFLSTFMRQILKSKHGHVAYWATSKYTVSVKPYFQTKEIQYLNVLKAI